MITTHHIIPVQLLASCKSLWVLSLFLLTSLGAVPVVADSNQQQAIQMPVVKLHDTLLEMMKNADTTSLKARYRSIEEVVNTYFDMATIAKVVLGRTWETLNAEAQQQFIDLFIKLTIVNYVDNFTAFNNEQFNILSIDSINNHRFIIKTELLLVDEPAVSLNYIVQKNGAKWQIISIIANGVNDLALRRTEYANVIKNQGLESLINKLHKKTARLNNP